MTTMKIVPGGFERILNDKQTRLYRCTNEKGLEAYFTNYGARIIALFYNGVNVTPAYDSLDPYLSDTIAPYHGATIGRYANRIAKGTFRLQDTEYNVPVNNAPNHLHGGPSGFHRQVWNIGRTKQDEITFTHFSKDGTEGYPGNLHVTVTYALTQDDELAISYTAKSDKATPFNITNHAFFNLNGEGSIVDHLLQINASQYTPVDETLIPTGIEDVANTAFDFRVAKKIGEDINKDEEQIKIGGGYDHNFVLTKESNSLSFTAKAIGDKTGIVMEVLTTEPGMQLFSGNFEAVKGDTSTFRNTFCLETQHFPDSPNQPSFPTTILEAGQTFTSKTIYRFSKA
ncbi:MAG TPA: aldose epimerase family protein [Flavisolibacter sp.]|nr:aldose epimerase family protein [Flavisolibacter sp.]